MARFLKVSTLVAAIASFAVGQMTATAHASPVTYDLILQGTTGGMVGGTGFFTVDGPINSTGLETLTVSDGLNLSFTIDGNTFASQPGGFASVTFANGALISIAYAGTLDSWSFSLVTGLLNYIYTDLVDPTHSTIGTVHGAIGDHTGLGCSVAGCAPALRHWSRRDGTACLVEEAEARSGSRSRLNNYIY